MNESTSSPILVVSGTGKTGRRVVQRLAARGLPVRSASRSSDARFDWTDEATWPGLLRGVRSVYVSYQPDLAMPGAAGVIRAFCQAASRAGVRRVVLLSGRGEDDALPSEAAVRETVREWTILRAAFFCQNFSEGMLQGSVLGGEIAFPAGDVAEPFVDADDLADVAVAALTEDVHIGKVYDLTGPRLLTFGEAASEIAEAAGRAVRYVPIDSNTFRQALSAEAPPEFAAFLTDLFARLLDGHNAKLGDGVERALGRRPRDFREYARTAASEGAWRG